MLTASNKIMQEEWVQRWLDKLTPKQKALVTEVLEDCNSCHLYIHSDTNNPFRESTFSQLSTHIHQLDGVRTASSG